MNEYDQILQQLQKLESDLLEMWDTTKPDSVEDTEKAEKLYLRYQAQMHELSTRADAGELFEYLIPKLTISIHIDVVTRLATLPQAEKLINLILDKDGAEAIDDEVIMKIFSFKNSKETLLKFFQAEGEVGNTEVEEKIFDTRDKEIISAYLNTRPKLSQRATKWILKQPEAVDILIANLAKNWPTKKCQEIIFSGLEKKEEKAAILRTMVELMPNQEWRLDKKDISISHKGELLIFSLNDGNTWENYQSSGSPSSFAIWMAKRKGWIK